MVDLIFPILHVLHSPYAPCESHHLEATALVSAALHLRVHPPGMETEETDGHIFSWHAVGPIQSISFMALVPMHLNWLEEMGAWQHCRPFTTAFK